MSDLGAIVARLEAIAPLGLAGSWDNVGLLLEGTRDIRRVFLCVDLVPRVVDEALAADADLIVAYHPPIFAGLKRLTSSTARGTSLLRLIRAGVHVYSPHTALDAARDGMGDWLLEPFGALAEVAPIVPDALDPTVGTGRRARLSVPVPLSALLPRLKQHLGLDHLRVAAGSRAIEHVAVCPGAGGSVFEQVTGVDLLLTGEMRHHDVLRWGEEHGTSVVLTDHTNTERGFLPRLAHRLADDGLRVIVSEVDADPLVVR
ncbi:MAG: dinuclear metal center YbgI/SA1388 family protein [Myxococcota bacterium]|jgi:dinuclear metal center YbgI/SA1388 family protein